MNQYPPDFDLTTRTIIEFCQPFTMTSPERIFALCEAVRYVVRHNIPGDIVECGVWKGGSMMAVAKCLQSLNQSRSLYLFDTFCGMTAPDAVDIDLVGRSAADLLVNSPKDSLVRAESSLQDVQRNFSLTDYDKSLVTYVVGPVEETVPKESPEKIALLRLDTDWYASTAHELRQLYPRLSAGGILIVDDYGHWNGARRAVDDFIAELREPLFLQRIDYTGRIAVKPWR
jgi:O-methyltransferase